MSLPIPIPQCDLSIRPATLGDVPFMDALQKANTRALGWFPTKQFEGYIAMNAVLIAEVRSEERGVSRPESEAAGSGILTPRSSLLTSATSVGYVIAKDRYSGRDDVGAVYQLAVTASARRKLVGAALVRAVFARAAYGCRLFCCWCAQDLAANAFWESLGFVPVAFRTGSRTKAKGKGGGPRTHIFWQRRVREGDDAAWWYPYQTRGGAIREDRLVFPIPPGTRWQEAKPVVLPEDARAPAPPEGLVVEKVKRLPKAKVEALPALTPSTAALHGKMALYLGAGRIKYVDRPRPMGSTATPAPVMPVAPVPEVVEKPKREPRRALRHEERALAFCRELRDRYVERVAEEPWLLEAAGKYELSRLLPAAAAVRLLPAA